MSETLYIVMPAYNEEANIRSVLEQWYPVVERVGGGSRLVVFDDGSRDATLDIMQEFAVGHPRFDAVTKPNSGHGATLLGAYRHALDGGADWVFQTDTDGQTLPDEFWQLWNVRGHCDMAAGWRCAREDGLSRVLVTRALRMVVRTCFGVDVTDANVPFRLMSAGSLRDNLAFVPEGFNLANVALAAAYVKRGMRVEWFPITFLPRQGGVNSINLRRIVGIGMRAIRDFLSINRAIDAASGGRL